MITKRFDALTGVRALAASLVFVYHNRKYWRAQLHPELLRLVNELHIGVSFFFVLSGFLLAYNYGSKNLNTASSFGKYIATRAARIFPLYWLILTAYYLDPKFGKMDFSFLTYSLIHGFSNALNLKGIAQAWSLSVEFTFYLLLPFLCVLERQRFRNLLLFLVFLFLFSWGMGELWHFANGNPKGYFYPLKFILGSTFPGRSTEFLAGMILAKILKETSPRFEKFWTFKYKTVLGFLGIFGVAYIIGLFQPDIFHHGTDHPFGWFLHAFVLPVFMVLALAGLISETTWLQRFFASKILILLGNASFAFYLIHISYVNIRLKWMYLAPDRNFVLLWMISILLYLTFEKPIYTAIRKLLG